MDELIEWNSWSQFCFLASGLSLLLAARLGQKPTKGAAPVEREGLMLTALEPRLLFSASPAGGIPADVPEPEPDATQDVAFAKVITQSESPSNAPPALQTLDSGVPDPSKVSSNQVPDDTEVTPEETSVLFQEIANGPIQSKSLRIEAGGNGDLIDPGVIEDYVADFVAREQPKQVTIEFVGTIPLANRLQFDGYKGLRITGQDAYLEQWNSYDDAASLEIINSQDVTIRDLRLGGIGSRWDGAVPQQNGIRVIGSSDVVIRNCDFEPTAGTMKHGVHVADSDGVVVQQCSFSHLTGIGVLTGTGIYPHPTEYADFFSPDQTTRDVVIQRSTFNHVSVAIAIDDATQEVLVEKNRIENFYAHAIVIEDGSQQVQVDSNRAEVGRGAMVVVGGGQTGVVGHDVWVKNNVAIGTHNESITVPEGYQTVENIHSAFHNLDQDGVYTENNIERDEERLRPRNRPVANDGGNEVTVDRNDRIRNRADGSEDVTDGRNRLRQETEKTESEDQAAPELDGRRTFADRDQVSDRTALRRDGGASFGGAVGPRGLQRLIDSQVEEEEEELGLSS